MDIRQYKIIECIIFCWYALFRSHSIDLVLVILSQFPAIFFRYQVLPKEQLLMQCISTVSE
ncbi:hypothetical protein CW304_31045 [Bacillus sp. UFRGS-B20]|nr:hypothetical protein CW304_31045 [Bacillus sp. UFRGS-B20]